MSTFDIGGGKQIIVGKGRLQLWANRGCLGAELTPKQMEVIGLTLWIIGRKMKREQKSGAAE